MSGRLVGRPRLIQRIQSLFWVVSMLSHLGCVAPGMDKTVDPPLLTTAPADLSPWTATGKLALTAKGETHTARFQWERHDATHDTVSVSGPFSMNRVVLERDGANFNWRDGDNLRPVSEIATLAPPLHLLTTHQPEIFGQWLLGYPANLEQGQIEVQSWQPVPPWRLPEQMIVSGDGYSVKIRISTWEMGSQ